MCLICNAATTELTDKQLGITYDVCDICGFIYKPKQYHLEKHDEKDQYNRHNNSFESKGYVEMFERFIDAFITPLNIKGKALEFGSGPGPVLKELLRRKGLEMYDFDPFYNNNETYLNHKYQLITSTEVVEHFYDPLKEFRHLISLLDTHGYLVIMTNLRVMDIDSFQTWWYRRDPTHVSFYTIESMEKLASILGLEIVNTNNKNVIVFRKEN